MYTVADLYDLTHTAAAPLLSSCQYPWEALAGNRRLYSLPGADAAQGGV